MIFRFFQSRLRGFSAIGRLRGWIWRLLLPLLFAQHFLSGIPIRRVRLRVLRLLQSSLGDVFVHRHRATERIRPIGGAATQILLLWTVPSRPGAMDKEPRMRSIAAPRLSRPDPGSAFMAAVTGIVFGYAAVLLVFLLQQNWILTSGGIPMPSDYLAYRAAGIAALRGNAASVYDPHSFHLLQVYLSKPFPNYFYWNYPPPFFFVTASLAMLPYVAAFLLWLGATAAAFAVAVGRIAGRPKGVMAVFASPVVFLTAYVGQNGFLSAALIGAFLLCLRERPIIAGILLASMTYKPQLG